MTAFFTAPSFAWGPGAVEQLSGLSIRSAGVLADPALAASASLRRVVEELTKDGASVEVVADVDRPHRAEAIDGLRARWRARPPEWIVAVGGGRVLDAAKGVRLALELPELSWDAVPPVLPLPERPGVHLAAIPTTSGSGAEASWAADLVAADGRPLEIADRRLAPEWAIVDPAFAGGIPESETVPLAVEAAAEAIEAYLSAWANPWSDALAIDAATTVLRRLPHAVRWSDDPDATAALHYAATAAGLAASNAQRGLAHAVARALEGPTGLSYARLIAAALPPVLDFDRSGARERLETLAAAVAPPGDRTDTPLSVRLRKLYDQVRLPSDLRGAAGGPGELSADPIVDRVLASPATLANPRVPNRDEVRALLAAIAGRPA